MMLNARPAVILLVEDDPGDQELTIRALKEGKIRNRLFIVQDGEEAIEYLFRRGRYAAPEASPRPDLILLDLNMPKLDGRQVLFELQNHPDFSRMVVVVLTTSKQEEDILKSYDLGVKSFVTKPLDFESFLDVVRGLKEYWFQVVVLPPRKEG